MPKKKTLTDAQVVRLRKRAANGESYTAIAEDIGVHSSFVGFLARGKYRLDAGGPIQRARHNGKKKGRRKSQAKKRATTASSNGRPQIADFAALSIDDASRFLQALAGEWPKIRESFLCIDAMVTRQTHEA